MGGVRVGFAGFAGLNTINSVTGSMAGVYTWTILPISPH